MFSEENALIERLFAPGLFINKDAYRVLVDFRCKFSWKVKYKYSDLLIISKRIFEKAINYFKDFKEIEGIVLIKDDKIGFIWQYRTCIICLNN
ncbi:MAG: hypothetical protein ACYCXQ_08730 [Candidatus Humimicrobiaceae bacterium]